MIKRHIILCGFSVLMGINQTQTLGQPSPWPQITQEAKPWARWWWMGNAVDEYNLSRLMRLYAEAGFGGLEIAPIYGAKGYEDRYLSYLSPQWMDMLRHTVRQADSLGMGIDLTVGTGWPFGGPQVGLPEAATHAIFRTFRLEEGKPFAEKIHPEEPRQQAARLLSLTAYRGEKDTMLITDKVAKDGTLQWHPDEGKWELYAVFEGKTRQAVKRAAPGGEGFTLDHFSRKALDGYLARFDSAFHHGFNGVRAFYNDSYEVYGADWTADFFDEFAKRRRYDFRLHIRTLLSDEQTEQVARLKSDYRQTVSDLLLENFTQPWTQWAHRYNSITKSQAHGSPGNLIDLYAAVDIPEVETFGSSYFPIPGLRRDSVDIRNVDPDPVMLKFASSAAHVTGKRLVSSETFTWLTEHFKTSLAQCKPEVEQCFLAGVNHVFYHGITYSPEKAGWPGWLFYASVNFVPTNSWWPHLHSLNNYITRVQSVLQSGMPDNELLLYWPVYDNWDDAEGRMMPFTVHDIDQWLHPTDFYKNVVRLHEAGYSFDFISDNLLANATVADGLIYTSAENTPYKALVVPVTRKMPAETLEKLLALVHQGATVFLQAIPEDVPGLGDYQRRHAQFEKALEEMHFVPLKTAIRQANIGSGRILLSADIVGALQLGDILGEPVAQYGLGFIRRKTAESTYYFIVNHQAEAVDSWIPFQSQSGQTVTILDPQSGRFGKTTCKIADHQQTVRIQLLPGEAIILRFDNRSTLPDMPDWLYVGVKMNELSIADGWTLNFKEGGPKLPASVEGKLMPWTEYPDEAYQSFSGIAEYRTTVTLGDMHEGITMLELQGVHESARVWVNGQEAGIAWSIPYRLRIDHLLKEGENTIRIAVANLMANRIRDMDRKGVEWRRYHEINFVNIDYQSFDASSWNVQPSGLAGPVRIVQYIAE